MAARRSLVFAGLLAVALGAGALQRARTVGSRPDGGWQLATGQTLHPSGEAVVFRGRPVDLALSPDGRTVYIKDSRGVVVLDAVSWTVRQELSFPKGGASLHGIAVSADDRTIYATNSENELYPARRGPDGRLAWEKPIALPGPGGKGASYPCGVALSPEGRRAYVCLSRNNALAEVDLISREMRRQIPVGVAPYDVVALPDRKTLAVTNWGGRRARPGERVADSAGTPTLVDPRGVASSGSVSFVAPDRGAEIAQAPAGLHPSDLALSPDGRTLFTADANSDTVTVLSAAARKTIRTIRIRPDARLPFGTAPTGLAVAPDGRTLFVACGGNNAVAVVDLPSPPAPLPSLGRSSPPLSHRANEARGSLGRGAGGEGKIRGWMPSGWYPGAVTTDGKSVFVVDVKGLGSRGAVGKDPGRNVYQYAGTARRLAIPDGRRLAALTRQALADAQVQAALTARTDPLPPLEHVVYVIKENRTYDQVFGDLPQGDGDPKLCLYGREVTPNHHALAEEFVLLDNFYCNGVLSADGHSWVTEGNVTDHLEKAFGGFTRSYTFGDDPLTYSSSGFLWDGPLDAGKSVVNFGEMDYSDETPDVGFGEILADWQSKTGRIRWGHRIGIARLKAHSHPVYPGWNMDIPDVVRADIFLAELTKWETAGKMPDLTLIYLPSDHTTGMTPGGPTPRAYLADNDLALGRVVEGISKSRFWPRTAIFVVEDDPQDGFDHVDGHRSLCLVVSPYARRNVVISNFYNQTAVLHTMASLLGAKPMNQMDALAPRMTACFTATPDLRPYACRPNAVPLTETVPKKAAAHRLDFSRPDAAGDDALNRVLWRAAKGDMPYPAALAGAHGRGLGKRGLRLAANTGKRDD